MGGGRGRGEGGAFWSISRCDFGTDSEWKSIRTGVKHELGRENDLVDSSGIIHLPTTVSQLYLVDF